MEEQSPPRTVTASTWARVARSEQFGALVAAKRRFIVPATVFFLIYYFALPILVGYAPTLMARKVFGVINIAYLFALSQFVMAWVVAALYVRAAGRFDEMNRRMLEGHDAYGELIAPVATPIATKEGRVP